MSGLEIAFVFISIGCVGASVCASLFWATKISRRPQSPPPPHMWHEQREGWDE